MIKKEHQNINITKNIDKQLAYGCHDLPQAVTSGSPISGSRKKFGSKRSVTQVRQNCCDQSEFVATYHLHYLKDNDTKLKNNGDYIKRTQTKSWLMHCYCQ